MGSEAVIFVLLAVIVGMVILWRDDISSKRQHVVKLSSKVDSQDTVIAGLTKRNAELEAEIQRLRTIPLTQKPDKTENAVIKAKSPAQVRQITEAAWGKFEEMTNGS
jgi:cell division protein FtsB